MTRRVFLTGATGTIGSAMVPRLLADPSTSITLLLRAPDDGAMQVRMRAMLQHWGHGTGMDVAARLQAVRGDIAQPGFGMPTEQQDQVAMETTHIIHCAASVKLNMPIDVARASAVLPTRTVLGLARRGQQAGVLQKVDLVSTVGVWGRTPGLMPERSLPEVRSFHNTYEEAKAEAEQVVWTEGQGLPITVHRPSMVVGDSITGRVMHFQVFYHLCEFLSGTRTFGVMPGLGQTRLDTVPVNWVADAIAWSSRQADTAGQIFHLCAGPESAVSLLQLQQTVRDAWQAAGRRVPPLRTVDRRWLERLVPVIGMLAGARNRRALRGLGPVLAYLAEDQGFDNCQTAATLAAAQLPVPSPHSYLHAVLAHYLQQRGSRAAS
jgi:thioester reductase-like protein